MMTRLSLVMTVLVVGASGATGRLLVEQLVLRGRPVRAVVRSPDKLPEELKAPPQSSLVHASLLDLSDKEMIELVEGCTAIASCLGHSMSLKGVYGPPRRLVADATRRLCEAVAARPRRAEPVRFVLMGTAGSTHRGVDDGASPSQKRVLAFTRALLPPQADHEEAAEHLRVKVGTDDGAVEWVVVRPDTLVDKDDPSPYDVHAAPTRNSIFDPGKTSRVNVARFMAELICDDETWLRWVGRMPVIYDKG